MEIIVLPYKRLGKKVFFRRFALNLSLEDFEQATGLSKDHWIELESGARAFTTDDIQLLTRLLDVNASWFLEEAVDESTSSSLLSIARSPRSSMGSLPGLMEVSFPNGNLVVVDPDFDAEALNRLLGVLERRS